MTINWLEPDWEQKRPTTKQIGWMWRGLSIVPMEDTPKGVTRFVDELKRCYSHGDAFFRQYHVAPEPALDWFASRNRLDEIDFHSRFLRHPAVQKQMPAMKIKPINNFPDFGETEDALTLDGQLAGMLLFGGPYERYAGPARDAKRLGADFCESLFGDRYTEVKVSRCHEPWSSWFHGIAWDSTWVILDQRHRTVSVMCGTDTD